jgi:peroxiredoxin family protein
MSNEITEKAKEMPGVSEKVAELEARVAKIEKKNNNLTMVLMSGEMDKAMAAFIIANGALAMGKEVTIFVTFWGMDVIKKPSFSTAGRGFLEKMVLWMRPKGPMKLPTSKMNVEGLNSLMDMAMEFGLKIIACQMSMDVMGIKKEDLLDGIEVGGVAAFLNNSYQSNTTLFI